MPVKDLFTSLTFESSALSVIGIGEESKKYIDEIKDWNSPLISAMMLERDFIDPEAGTEVVILIITENVDATILAKNLKQSGLLTIIVATCEIRAMEGSYDSIAIVPEDKVIDTVKTVAEILTKPPQYICLDLNDLICIMKDSGTFYTFSHTSSVEKGGMTNLANYLREKLKGLPSLEKMLVNITLSKAAKELLKVEDLMIIQKVFTKLPDSIKIVWGFDVTENLASDELAINIIATSHSRKRAGPALPGGFRQISDP